MEDKYRSVPPYAAVEPVAIHGAAPGAVAIGPAGVGAAPAVSTSSLHCVCAGMCDGDCILWDTTRMYIGLLRYGH